MQNSSVQVDNFMVKDSLMIKVGLWMIIFSLSMFVAKSVSSIPLGLILDPGIETRNYFAISRKPEIDIDTFNLFLNDSFVQVR